MKLLVTGGAGFIGSNFVNLLASGSLKLGYSDITVLDKLTYAADLKHIKPLIDSGQISFIEGDLCDAEIVSKLVSENDVIVNFAAESHVDNSILNATEFVKTNILGTQNILTALKNNPSAKLLQVSTDEVYGSIDKGSWNEKAPLAPNSPYSASKAAADLLVLASHRTHKLNVLITRCSNNFGPRQHPEKLIPKLIMSALQDKPLTIYGDGTNIREWIHVDDHCEAIAWVLKNGIIGNVYNIGSSDEYTNIEIAKMILRSIPTSTSEVVFVEDRLGHDYRYSLNDDSFRSASSINNRNFESSLRETISWYKNKHDAGLISERA